VSAVSQSPPCAHRSLLSDLTHTPHRRGRRPRVSKAWARARAPSVCVPHRAIRATHPASLFHRLAISIAAPPARCLSSLTARHNRTRAHSRTHRCASKTHHARQGTPHRLSAATTSARPSLSPWPTMTAAISSALRRRPEPRAHAVGTLRPQCGLTRPRHHRVRPWRAPAHTRAHSRHARTPPHTHTCTHTPSHALTRPRTPGNRRRTRSDTDACTHTRAYAAVRACGRPPMAHKERRARAAQTNGRRVAHPRRLAPSPACAAPAPPALLQHQ